MLAPLQTDLVGRSFASLFAPGARRVVDALLEKLSDVDMTSGNFVETTCALGAGDPRWIRLNGVHVSETPYLVVVVLSQFVDRSMMVEALHGPRKPEFDRLTGVVNRRALDEAGRVLSDRSDPRPLVVASWDVDGLKRINDTRGHAVGDHVLRWAGYRLFVAVGAAGLVARVGRDEFVVLLRFKGRMSRKCFSAQPREGSS